jgi:hypothetical protein
MVDAETSTSAPSVSRRKLLSCAAMAPALTVASPAIGPMERSDPILPLWCEWQLSHASAIGLCQRAQGIESRLMRAVGFPQVFIPLSNSARGICCQYPADIDQAVAAGDCPPDLASALHAELAVRRARWDAEAEALGFDEANRQELEAWRKEEEAVRAVFRTRAATLAGVEIKLALMIKLCATFSVDPELAMPHLRSTLADVKRLRRTLGTLRC